MRSELPARPQVGGLKYRSGMRTVWMGRGRNPAGAYYEDGNAPLGASLTREGTLAAGGRLLFSRPSREQKAINSVAITVAVPNRQTVRNE
jgi:hypothetical protein